MKTNCYISQWTYTNDSFVIWLMTNNKKKNAVEMVNIHTLYLLVIDERCTRYDRQITCDCSSFCLHDFY